MAAFNPPVAAATCLLFWERFPEFRETLHSGL
jgi:hypothetical protein